MTFPALRRSADLALGTAVVVLLVVLVLSDRADTDHALWRDPISYFGAAVAPYSLAFRISLAGVGLAIALWVASRARRLQRSVMGLGMVASVSLVGLALWPIDCSPVDELCEVVIRGRAMSASHNVHSVFAVTLFVSLALVAVIAARNSSDLSSRARLTVWIGATAAVAATAAVLFLPFTAGAGISETIAAGATVVVLKVSRAM